MKRDMDLVRKILLAIEDNPSGFAPKDIQVEGYQQEEVAYHVYISIEAGLIDGVTSTSFHSKGPEAIATRLTWAGHDFLDAAREPRRWQEAKRLIGRIGGASVQVWTNVLTHLMLGSLGIPERPWNRRHIGAGSRLSARLAPRAVDGRISGGRKFIVMRGLLGLGPTDCGRCT